MSIDTAKPTETPKPEPAKPPKTPSRAEAIAVRVLKFDRPTDVPGKNVADSVTCKPVAEGGRRWEVEFQPWIRHHRITYFEPDKNATPDVMFIHESRCTWKPL